ncbi:MAG: hypothetical protein EAS51_03410 [Microbacteriaceae bacterium]|nr:MAG: hypothetical protein EAS51_03410 [Microbacteriaceae bacterium]
MASPLRQIARSARTRILGSMLLAAAIAAAHDGRAYARNPSGQGARVALSLPVEPDEEVPEAAHPGR